MIITKTANLLTNKVVFSVELDRPADYSGVDVYPDERLAELLMEISKKISTDIENRRLKSYGKKNTPKF